MPVGREALLLSVQHSDQRRNQHGESQFVINIEINDVIDSVIDDVI